MAETNGDQGASPTRSSRIFARKSRDYSTRNTLFAIVAVAAMILTVGVAALGGAQVTQQKWQSVSLSFGSDPVSQNLVVQFGRVSYIDQPTEYNTTGFIGATLTGNGAFLANSSGYGIYQWNSTTGSVASANYGVAASLGSNTSYLFTDQRVALNGSGGTWTYVISEGSQTSAMPTTGNVSDGSAGATQNRIWVQSVYSGGNYTFTVSDYEYKPGGYQTYTTYTVPSTAKIPRLQFFEVYVYLQKSGATVSIVNTTNSAVMGSVTAAPVLDGNLSSVAYLTDQVTMASATHMAMIVDKTFLVNHNAFASVPATQGAFIPLDAGTFSTGQAAPFDPGSAGVKVNATHLPTSNASYTSVNGSASQFSSLVNSSSPASEESSALNTSLLINGSSKASVANAKQTLTTFRAAAETPLQANTGTMYVSTWNPATIESQVWSFLTNYVSAGTGIPAADVEIQSYLITNVTVDTTLSSTAAGTIHTYLASALPGMLSTSHLALVNQATGAVDAGADLGDFLSPSGSVYVPHATASLDGAQQLFDPVNGKTYASAEAAGFPSGSTFTSSGAIAVPYQAAFLGFGASGIPEFGVGGCFLVCLPSSLSGAASAVSNFVGSAATSVSNAVGTVSNTVSQDIIQPVAGTLSNDLDTLATNVSRVASSVIPFMGGTTGSISSAIGSGITGLSHTLGSVGGPLASGLSGAAGAIMGGVDSFGNNVYHLGTAVGSALSTVGSGIENGATKIVNTLGTAVGTASAVLSPWFSEAGNDVIGGLTSTGRSLASLGSSIANAGMGALNTIGNTIASAAGGAWSFLSNGFGQIGSDLVNGLSSIFGGGGTPFSWLTSLGGSVSELVIVVVIIAIVVITLVVLFLVLRRHKHKKSGHQLGAESAHGSSRGTGRLHHKPSKARVGHRRGARA